MEKKLLYHEASRLGRSLLDGSEKNALTTDDVEVILTRLERAREAIQEIRPILLSHPQKKQLGYTETENMNSLKSGKVTDKFPEESTERDPKLVISETIALLGKISSLIQAKKAEIVLTSRTEEDIQTKAAESRRGRKVETKDDMSPEQNFYFLLADSDLGTLRKSSGPITKR